MYQNGATGIKPLQRNVAYVGGICKAWYIPVEDVAVFPRVNAGNQYLVSEPALLPGKSWFGPLYVPRNSIGFTETMERTNAGPYYKTKLEAVSIGESPQHRVNLENMAYYKYLFIAKIRAGGTYLIIGTQDSPLTLDNEFTSGKGSAATIQTALSFLTETISKAMVLPTFTADTTAPGTGGGGGGEDVMPNHKENIAFADQATVSIPWTPARLEYFGIFPIVEVWIQEPGEEPYLFTGGSIEVDAPPPLFSELTVKIGTPATGFIILS